MPGFIPEITTRITVKVHTDTIDDAISRIESDPFLSQCPSLIETLSDKKDKLEELEDPVAHAVAERLQSNQEMIISSKHYITGMMANSVDISQDGSDYLVGNTDRHWGNWGFAVDNDTNLPTGLYPLMDFNKSFLGYDTPEGGRCLTTEGHISQREAALRGVRAVGLGQLAEVRKAWFPDERTWEMFSCRLEALKAEDGKRRS